MLPPTGAPARRRPRRWRPSALTYLIAILALSGLCAALYSMTASWFSAVNQSRVIERAHTNLHELRPPAAKQLRLAEEYNRALSAGVRLDPGANVPVGDGGSSAAELRYSDMLNADDDGLMGRIRIPGIEVDLPIFHGTSESTLLRGAGHLEGSHLPVGGTGTRTVITAHRGLAESTMFTHLDQVRQGDLFTIEVLGRVLAYRVFDIQVIAPEDSGSLHAVAGEDLATLVTCTPLGINSHRIVVTGKRVSPAPSEALDDAGKVPEVPGFPWWALFGGAGLLLVSAYVVHRGFADPPHRTSPRERRNGRPA